MNERGKKVYLYILAYVYVYIYVFVCVCVHGIGQGYEEYRYIPLRSNKFDLIETYSSAFSFNLISNEMNANYWQRKDDSYLQLHGTITKSKGSSRRMMYQCCM